MATPSTPTPPPAAPAAPGAAGASPANDKTSSVFVTKEKFGSACKELSVPDALAEQLWAKLAESSTQRIIGGASAPRQDAANVNNWHWAEIDLLPWAKERLEGMVVGLAGKNIPDKGWVKVSKMEECKGEASVSNRKGKRIVAYEINVKCKWEGQIDYDDVSGELLLPYISEDVEDSQYEIKLTAKDPKDDSHKKALKFLTRDALPTLKASLKTFTTEIYAK